MGNAVELVEGLPMIEASVINFASILEEPIFISYLPLILFFIVKVEGSQSISTAVGKGEGKDARKKKSSKSEAGYH